MRPAGVALRIALFASLLLVLSPIFTAHADAAPSGRPQCSIIRPYPDATESGKLRITGTAVMASDPIIRVQLRIDDGSVLIANGTDSWHFDLDTTRMANGPHAIEAKSFDGSQYSESVTVSFSVNNKKTATPESDFPWYLVIAVIIIVAAVAIAGWRLTRRASP